MNLQNGYKVLYEKTADGKRTFYASKTGFPTIIDDAIIDDKIAETVIGQYKLIYEKDGQFYGSETGLPTADDHCFTEFDKIFKVADAQSMQPSEDDQEQKQESQNLGQQEQGESEVTPATPDKTKDTSGQEVAIPYTQSVAKAAASKTKTVVEDAE